MNKSALLRANITSIVCNPDAAIALSDDDKAGSGSEERTRATFQALPAARTSAHMPTNQQPRDSRQNSLDG